MGIRDIRAPEAKRGVDRGSLTPSRFGVDNAPGGQGRPPSHWTRCIGLNGQLSGASRLGFEVWDSGFGGLGLGVLGGRLWGFRV